MIKEFRAMTFMNVPDLTHLNLAENRISSLDGNRFQAFNRLETLNLSRNAITAVSAVSKFGS
jgi:Leucine-rich repeat (LRR) protein